MNGFLCPDGLVPSTRAQDLRRALLDDGQSDHFTHRQHHLHSVNPPLNLDTVCTNNPRIRRVTLGVPTGDRIQCLMSGVLLNVHHQPLAQQRPVRGRLE